MEKTLPNDGSVQAAHSNPAANRTDHHHKLSVCPNCDTALKPEDNFCFNCGQENHALKLPLGHILYEFVESITHFDGKLWNTLKAIFTRPGKMTTDFLAGQRVRYVPPARFYVFVSVIFFFLIGKFVEMRTERNIEEAKKQEEIAKVAKTKSVDFATLIGKDSLLRAKGLYRVARTSVDMPKDSTAARRWIQQLRSASDARLDSLLSNKDEKSVTPQSRQKLRDVIALVPDTLKNLTTNAYISLSGVNIVTFNFKSEASQEKFLRKTNQMSKMSDESLDSLIRAEGEQPSWLKRAILRQSGKFMASREDSAKALMHVVIKDLSVVMFILMPFVAILLLLFYFRRGRYYYEHLIFSVHIHTVLFLFVSLALLVTYYASEATTNAVVNGIIVVCWLYFLLSLKTVYKQGWIKTTVKFLLLSFSYVLVASLFTLGAVGWGFVTF